ncbi:exosortase/archaeosortase family protein [Candidatus Woesebacteria bacterium]|nr:exosortase/archaeosortase family protein [Candidatus Woesebacteria bacterium]
MDKLKRSQLRFRVFKQSKRTLRNVLILAVLVLITLPFWTSLQSLLTQVVMSIGWYRNLQDLIVPHELRVTGTLLTLFKFPIRVGNSFIEWDKAAGGREVIYLAWNCVGWQTLVLFGITLITGLSGKHTLFSKLETLVIGILGTYIVNTLRLVLVVIVYFAVGRPLGIVFHDYFSNLLTIGWLLLFWRFSYSFVLEEKQVAELSKS